MSYGKIYNSSGSVIKSDGHSGKDAALIAKPGNRYEGALMAYWMRLTWDGIGMHQGRVPRYPASHGCIRTYSKAVHSVFHKVKVGYYSENSKITSPLHPPPFLHSFPLKKECISPQHTH